MRLIATTIVSALTHICIHGAAPAVTFTTDSASGAICSISLACRPDVNWLIATDGSQYPWVDSRYGWGLGRLTADGVEYEWNKPSDNSDVKNNMSTVYQAGPIRIEVSRQYDKDGNLQETYVFRNTDNRTIHLTDIAINTPFNDNYPDAKTCYEERCNTHIWTSGNSSYVFNTSMGGQPGGLGLLLQEGSMKGYEIRERDLKKGLSNFRGIIQLNPDDTILTPGSNYIMRWILLPARDWNDFTRKAINNGTVVGEAEKYVVETGDTINLTFRSNRSGMSASLWRAGHKLADNDEATISYSEVATIPGEYKYTLQYDGGKTSNIECFVISNIDSLIRRRCNFITSHQQFSREGDARDGAFIVYDNETETQYINGESGRRRADCDEGRERIAMGILLAQEYKRTKDPMLLTSLEKYTAFIRRIQKPDYTTNSTPDFTGKNRGYNYAWVADYWFAMYEATADPSYLKDAYRTLRALTRHFGHSFYCIDIPTYGYELLKKEGLNAEADTLLADFKAMADTFAANGHNYPLSEVNYEQSIVAPSVIHLLNVYKLTSDEKYLKGAEEQLPLLESFGGRQPSYHLNDIAIRHWDGYWFGKRQMWGDTFPHYWSTLSGIAYALYADVSGDYSYAERATNIIRNNFCLFTEDGRGSAAYMYPDKVNGKEARFYDPFANDQDWVMVFYNRYFRTQMTDKQSAP